MNRKKKINSILKKRLKKQNSKLHTSNKPKYISKAEREKMALEAQESALTSDDVTLPEEK
ncbi:DUF2986 domain-containing protein [Vibrio aphrogenes]|uniref:DUF2986 domain-containing protein n=1 Tax=Vibrio aphrogenes TaxID=1891186 RepID=UPI000B35FD3E|nr:DUF2986 domain-containing protein [Vibrio aphrogenes]